MNVSIRNHMKLLTGLALGTTLLLGCDIEHVTDAPEERATAPAVSMPAAAVDERWIRANESTSKEWPTYGLDYAETRFSHLDQINDGNVQDLGLLWTYDLESTRGVEATPLVVDGVMYVSASWSVVHAIDARSGKRLWTYDPEVPRALGYKGCCGVVNRGVALYQGKVFVGSLDGRLVALDAGTGARVWEQDTVIDHSHIYSITGAPRVYKGNVLIGNGGADFGVRGYVTAYDAVSGELRWRWFTVPGDPSKPYENEAMARAAKTWDPAGKYWVSGGGGTPWDTMAYDPELNLIYIGTGNGSPWSRKMRSPAGGDNLYLASLVALNADTGEYEWHYQETPGDSWDYTSTQPMILADIEIAGEPRKVILHAPKNGFFFVIDRTDGSFISADPFVPVNWATGYDAAGRPIEIAAARGDEPYDAIPGPSGAHTWQPMSYNPETGLVYLPARNMPFSMYADKEWTFNANLPGRIGAGLGLNIGVLPAAPSPENKPFGRLIAWDPVARKEAWRVDHVFPSNAGTLTTAGDLVFQGTADGRFVAYNASTGQQHWESPVGVGIVAAPATYEIDGVQYVSVAAGWGGGQALYDHAAERVGPGTVFTYALGGRAPLPEFAEYPVGTLVAGVEYDPAQVQDGGELYYSNCLLCHGMPGVNNGGSIGNLGYISAEALTNLDVYLFDSIMVFQGMPDFSGKLTSNDAEKITAFIQDTVASVRPVKTDHDQRLH